MGFTKNVTDRKDRLRLKLNNILIVKNPNLPNKTIDCKEKEYEEKKN